MVIGVTQQNSKVIEYYAPPYKRDGGKQWLANLPRYRRKERGFMFHRIMGNTEEYMSSFDKSLL